MPARSSPLLSSLCRRAFLVESRAVSAIASTPFKSSRMAMVISPGVKLISRGISSMIQSTFPSFHIVLWINHLPPIYEQLITIFLCPSQLSSFLEFFFDAFQPDVDLVQKDKDCNRQSQAEHCCNKDNDKFHNTNTHGSHDNLLTNNLDTAARCCFANHPRRLIQFLRASQEGIQFLRGNAEQQASTRLRIEQQHLAWFVQGGREFYVRPEVLHVIERAARED